MDSIPSTGTAATVAPQGIPAALKALPQWVVWKSAIRDGKPTKLPYNARTGDEAESNNPATWSTFDEALARFERGGYSGIGFVFSADDENCGVDLDACRNAETGELTPWARDVVDAFPDAYWEISPSGEGLKCVAVGAMPGGKGRANKLKGVPSFGTKAPEVACYSERRFWTLTGQRLEGSAIEPGDCQAPLDALLVKYFPAKPINRKANTPVNNCRQEAASEPTSTLDRLISDCASASNGQRSEVDFKLCCHAVKVKFDREALWERVKTVGKFSTAGRGYFDRTMDNAAERVASNDDLRETAQRTEAANARRFIDRNGDNLRWCDPWEKWLCWDERRWGIDRERRAEAMMKVEAQYTWEQVGKILPDVGRELATELVRFAKASNQKNGIGNALALARSEPGIPILPAVLDRDVWALNVLNGTLNLRDITIRPHDRADLITKVAPVTYDPTADCPTWIRVVDEIFRGDKALITYVRKTVGYCLTGSTAEHILPFLYGTGANGKSLFLGTILTLMGEDYSMKAPPDLLMAKKGTHPTERADLFGKRFVAAIEAEDGRRLAEALVKELSGGDKVRARRMREDFWEFAATHKIWLAANHKPTIRGTDHGIWRRVKLIPFTVTFAPEQQDKALPAKLEREMSGILNWALLGCMEWQNEGLGEPEAVANATADYRNEMDIIGEFLDSCCIVAPSNTVGATELFTAFVKWCEKSAEHPLKQREFGIRLTERGFETLPGTGGRKVRHGLGLLKE